MGSFHEHKNLEGEDFRPSFLAVVTEKSFAPNGSVIEPDTVVKVVANGQFAGSRSISFGLPNASALYLDFALKSHNHSYEMLKSLDYVVDKNALRLIVDREKESTYFDLLEERIASIIFSYTSVETYVNSQIPEEYIYIKQRKDGRNEERYNKEQIERYLPLQEKIQEILGAIKGKKLSKDNKIWHDFVKLERDRNRLIHVKSKDTKSTDEKIDTLWQILVKKDCPFYPKFAYDLISYYDDPSETRWLAKFPELGDG